MDLVSLETSAENEFIKSRIVQSIEIFYIYIYCKIIAFKHGLEKNNNF